MGVRKQGEQNIRKLTRLGKKSLGLTLPVEIIQKLHWKERQKVVVKLVRRRIIIKDWPARRSLRSRGGKKQHD